jgi:glycosyltransferase involved in cell wall biosynthesis
MHIAIDGRTIVRQRTGIGVYAERLVRSLLTIDRKNAYTLFMAQDDPSLQAPNLTKVLLPGSTTIGPNRIWENLVLPRFLSRHAVDIYFSPGYLLPFVYRSRLARGSKRGPLLVVTIHDLVSYHYPETFTRKMRVWQKLFVRNAVRVADCVLTISEATKRDLHHFYQIPDDIVKVGYLTVDKRFQPTTDSALLERVQTAYELPAKFILYVGTLEPRKNVGRLAAAYARLPEQLREEYGLVLAGRPGWYFEEIKREITALGLRDQIRILGYVSLSDLPTLYTLASVFAYPSLYEGFGIPPLEAMACGTPVICSRSSSLPEVIGDAGILVDPLNVDEISTQLQRLLQDENLRSILSGAGMRRAQLFDADVKAAEVLQIFEGLYGQRRENRV